MDETIRTVCRPTNNQRILFNGHKRIYAIKFQSVVAPNGLIANLHGPVEEKKLDSAMLTMSNLYNQLLQYSKKANGETLSIHGDPAYPLCSQLQSAFKNKNLTLQHADFNKSMSTVRASLEWVFGEILNYFPFSIRKNLKTELSAVGKMYCICALLKNAHTSLYRSLTLIILILILQHRKSISYRNILTNKFSS